MARGYYGTKRILAWPQDKEYISTGDSSDKILKQGYAVQYPDGYISWSPKEVFDGTYQGLDTLSFGHALGALKAGCTVKRFGWERRWLSFSRDQNRIPLILHWSAYGKDSSTWDTYRPTQSDMCCSDWQILYDSHNRKTYDWVHTGDYFGVASNEDKA